MARLIDDLLDVSRLARGQLAIERRPCDLAAIAFQTTDGYRASFEAKGITLELSRSEPVWVEGDAVRFAQMIGNLLHNAQRFTDRGGRVHVAVEADRARGEAQVTIADTGTGMGAALLARLFDPFSQAEQDLARSRGGLGLGLALTKGLATLHGGTVSATSEGPGKGSTFVMRVPLAARPVAALGEPEEPRGGGARRVLVVEDSRDAAETLGDVLRLEGHEVRLAFDALSGLAVAAEFAPDVVVSDLGLPGSFDGYALARRLREDPRFVDVKLVALSGYANEDARRRSREAGFDEHLAKPPDLDQLARVLAERS